MNYKPDFIKYYDVFKKEKDEVKSLDDWVLFSKKWFDQSKWPKKTKKDLAKEKLLKREPIKIGGRDWLFTDWIYKLEPEARYEYFKTCYDVGNPLKFPDETGIEKKFENGWRQECPFCEISTDAIGDEVCPKCGKKMIYIRYSE